LCHCVSFKLSNDSENSHGSIFVHVVLLKILIKSRGSAASSLAIEINLTTALFVTKFGLTIAFFSTEVLFVCEFFWVSVYAAR